MQNFTGSLIQFEFVSQNKKSNYTYLKNTRATLHESKLIDTQMS